MAQATPPPFGREAGFHTLPVLRAGHQLSSARLWGAGGNLPGATFRGLLFLWTRSSSSLDPWLPSSPSSTWRQFEPVLSGGFPVPQAHCPITSMGFTVGTGVGHSLPISHPTAAACSSHRRRSGCARPTVCIRSKQNSRAAASH